MKLHMNLCDVDVWFEIYNYRKNVDEENAYSEWCNTNLSLQSKYINYSMDGWEVFLNVEVEYLKSAFKELLNGNIREKSFVKFVEPDFEFVMNPITTLYSEPGKVIYKNGAIKLDISVDFKICFWCDAGFGSNVFTMTLNREEISAFCTYLQLITGEIDINSNAVNEYVKNGYLHI